MTCTAANGTKLSVDQSDTGVFTEVADRVTIDMPEITRPDIECTDLDSEAMEFDGGAILDYGEMSGTLNFKPNSANHAILLSLLVSGATVPWKLTFADADETEWPFEAYIKSFKPGSAEVNGKLTAEYTLKLSGKITFPS